MIADLVRTIRDRHDAKGATRPEILERVFAAIPMPEDMRAFYRELGEGASLFDERYLIHSVDDLARTDVDDLGIGWFTFCDVGDGNFVAFDSRTVHGSYCDVIDCFNETLGEPGSSKVIAKSFTEFLERALGTDGCPYWLDDGFAGYGYV